MEEEEEEEEIVEDVAAERFRWVGMLEVVDRRFVWNHQHEPEEFQLWLLFVIYSASDFISTC